MKTLKQKLSSRKFWAALTAWVTSLLTAFNVTENTIARVVLIVSGIGALIAYMVAESHIDASRVSNERGDENAE